MREKKRLKTKLIWITPDAEKIIMYCARVSNPSNQENNDTKLLNYCIKNNHWSIFEMASACFEIETSRAISAQILRHKSFAFQEFSQRYAEAQGFENYHARRQDIKNRQNSIDDLDSSTVEWFNYKQKQIQELSKNMYKEALEKGVAKEQARFLLPMSTSSRLYMSGTLRSWLHYLKLRSGNGTQKEHQEIAINISNELSMYIPVISHSMGLSNAKTY